MATLNPKHIATAVVSVAVVAAFCVGAFTLAQANPSFDPQNFTSAYSKGYEDATQGYQANLTETDADANRNKDDEADASSAADSRDASQDAFTNTPANTASGTTAYNVTGDASQGSIGIASGQGSGTGASGGNANAGGAMVVPTGNGTGGTAQGGGNGEQTGGGQNPTPAPTPTPTPDQPSRELLPNDPVPDKKADNLGFDPINNSNKNLADIDLAAPSTSVNITPSFVDENMLYVGQKVDAWMVFCSLEATLSYWPEGEDWPTSIEWRCNKDQFDAYPYFKIVDFPPVVPSEPFDIVVAWRIQPNAEWNYETVTYTPVESRTYVVSTALDASGNNQVLYTYSNNGQTINLFSSANALMRSIGALGDDNATLSKLLIGWTEDGQLIDYFFEPTPGRHVIAPGRFVDVPEGYTVKLKNFWMNSDFSIPENDGGQYPCALQTITAVDGSARGMLFPDRYGRISINLQPGIQALDIEAPNTVSMDRLEIPETLWYVNTTSGQLAVRQGFSVAADNPNYANLSNGILTSKNGSQYLGIPLNFQTLDVPEGIDAVNFTAGNNLKRVTLNAAHTGEIPAANWENLHNCTIVVADEVLDAFATANRAVLDEASGNTVSPKSNPLKRYFFSNDTLISDDEAVHFVDTGIDIARVAKAHTLTAGCLDNCPNITTLILTDDAPYVLEDGCLAGSAVNTIVCSTDEQWSYVDSRLAAAGADPDSIHTTKATTSDEGYRYYNGYDSWMLPTTVVFEVPDSIETFSGVGTVGGYGMTFGSIAAGTFQNHPNLAWADLADSVGTVGANAFAGCPKLQGVFFNNPGNITVGVNAFADCPSMRFLASNAANGDFASNERPNSTCVMYAPTNCTGYHDAFLSFTPDSNVAEYAVDEQADGSLVLYGANDDQGEWLLLAAGSNINGRIVLSPDTVEIYSNAFMSTQGTFTINWEDLDKLQYVDDAAFMDCSVAGDVFVGTWRVNQVVLGNNAFADCPNITSFTSECSNFNLGEYAVFGNCTSLERVKLDAAENGNVVMPGAFDGCSNLHTLELTNLLPIKLGVFAADKCYPFQFNPSHTFEQEEQTLHIVVPEYVQDTYLSKWLYPMVGAENYDAYYKYCRKQLVAETDLVPTDVQAKQRMSEGLLVAENHLRTMMGMPLVDHSSFISVEEHNGYVFELVDGVETLTGAPEDATVIDFSKVVPESFDQVAIGQGAFATCKNLARVVVTDRVCAINSGAFAGCDNVVVQLPQTVCTRLAGGTAEAPFTFGAPVQLQAPASAANDYLTEWPRQCVGVFDDYSMSEYLSNTLFGGWNVWMHELPTTDEFNEAANAPFVVQENYLRGLMGLDAISGTSELTYYHDASEWLDEWLPWLAPLPDIEDPWDMVDEPAEEENAADQEGHSGNASEELLSSGADGIPDKEAPDAIATASEPAADENASKTRDFAAEYQTEALSESNERAYNESVCA